MKFFQTAITEESVDAIGQMLDINPNFEQDQDDLYNAVDSLVDMTYDLNDDEARLNLIMTPAQLAHLKILMAVGSEAVAYMIKRPAVAIEADPL